MEVIGILTDLTMLLTIVLLALLILILGIILGKLLELKDENNIVIKIEKYNLHKKVKKHKKKHKKGKKHKSNVPQLPCYNAANEGNGYEQKERERQEVVVRQSMDAEGALQNEQDNQDNFCSGIKIKIVDPSSPFQTGKKIQFEENTNGNMFICGKKEEFFLVKPIVSLIGEKDYKYAALGSCFEMSQEVRSGCTYKITEVRQACLMKKEEGKYIVHLKGVLCLEEE